LIENELKNGYSKNSLNLSKSNTNLVTAEPTGKVNNFLKSNIQDNEVIYLKYHNEFYELTVIDRDNAIVKYKELEDSLNKIAYTITTGKGIAYWKSLYKNDKKTKIIYTFSDND
jgi:hypothetical protein